MLYNKIINIKSHEDLSAQLAKYVDTGWSAVKIFQSEKWVEFSSLSDVKNVTKLMLEKVESAISSAELSEINVLIESKLKVSEDLVDSKVLASKEVSIK